MGKPEPVADRLDRHDARLQSLRHVVRVMARKLGMDWEAVTRQARINMEQDEEKRAQEARRLADPDA